jgi:endoglycosylceramidase
MVTLRARWPALLALVVACGTHAEAPARRFRVEGGMLRDQVGRAIVMHGADVASVHKHPPYFADFTADDYARLRTAWGFDSIRLLTTWAAIEPSRGVFDDRYLDGLEERVTWAEAAGLLVVVDMHQDLYGEGFVGGDGAPRWTCDESRYAAFKPLTPWFLGYLDPNLSACFDQLWQSDDLQGHYANAWRHLAARLAKHPNVIGFDVMNEPQWGSYSIGGFEADLLQAFYEKMVRAVREVAPDWVAFLEPSASRNLGMPTKLEPFTFGNVVYSPHSYDREAESGNGFDAARREAVLTNFTALRAEATHLGAALWIGEYGGNASAPGIAPYMTAEYDGAAAALAGTAYWAYDKDDGYGLLNADGSEKAILLDAVVRPYPERVAGDLRSFAFDDVTSTLTVVYVPRPSTDLGTEIFVPMRRYPRGVSVECAGCRVVEAPGLVRLFSSGSAPVTVTLRPR